MTNIATHLHVNLASCSARMCYTNPTCEQSMHPVEQMSHCRRLQAVAALQVFQLFSRSMFIPSCILAAPLPSRCSHGARQRKQRHQLLLRLDSYMTPVACTAGIRVCHARSLQAGLSVAEMPATSYLTCGLTVSLRQRSMQLA